MPHIFAVRAAVPDESRRAAFDAWYSREHLPDAVKSFGCKRAWRYWLANDPAVHLAMLKDKHVDVPMKKHDNIPL